MNKISWCKKQKRGIKIITPNEDVCEEYLNSCDEKLGIKCEIHDCSIELLKFVNGFNKRDIDFIIRLKEARINVQYYLKKPKEIDPVKVKEFIMQCKILIKNLQEDEIKNIRQKISES